MERSETALLAVTSHLSYVWFRWRHVLNDLPPKLFLTRVTPVPETRKRHTVQKVPDETLALCSCCLRFLVRYCVVGGCWGVFRVLPSALTFLLYRLSTQSQICAFSFLGMAEPIGIVVFLRACDLWCACDLCFLQRVGGFGFGFGYIMLNVALVVLFRGV